MFSLPGGKDLFFNKKQRQIIFMKPGYKTTEFWLTSAAAVLGLLFASGVISDGSQIDKVLGMASTVLAGMGYSVSRGLAKKND